VSFNYPIKDLAIVYLLLAAQETRQDKKIHRFTTHNMFFWSVLAHITIPYALHIHPLYFNVRLAKHSICTVFVFLLNRFIIIIIIIIIC